MTFTYIMSLATFYPAVVGMYLGQRNIDSLIVQDQKLFTMVLT